MTDAEIVEAVAAEAGVARDELEHIAACDGGCSLTGGYDEGGPWFCLKFEKQFRGLVEVPVREPLAPAVAAALLSGSIPMLMDPTGSIRARLAELQAARRG